MYLFSSLQFSDTTYCSTSRLVEISAWENDDCSGDAKNSHFWPLDFGSKHCYGWEGTDSTGKKHKNSAGDFQCTDGVFSFKQYPGTLKCNFGSGNEKDYSFEKCQLGMPPSFHEALVDNACCLDPSSEKCKIGVPTDTTDPADVFMDGEVCDQE